MPHSSLSLFATRFSAMMVRVFVLVDLLLMGNAMRLLTPSNPYNLIHVDSDLSSSNASYCSTSFIQNDVYRIPRQCHAHLVCDPYYCDDKSFRCTKLREILCCLYDHVQTHCPADQFAKTRDHFRAMYFHMSIQHGYCEINLERIEKNDYSYCLVTDLDTSTTSTTTTTSLPRTSYKYIHRYRHRLASRPNRSLVSNFDYLRRESIVQRNVSSACALIETSCLLVLLSIPLSMMCCPLFCFSISQRQ